MKIVRNVGMLFFMLVLGIFSLYNLVW
jgi:hypothetical protein